MRAPRQIVKDNPTQVVGSTGALAFAAAALKAHDLWSFAGFLLLVVGPPLVTFLDNKLRG